jgi:hypothetical protein
LERRKPTGSAEEKGRLLLCKEGKECYVCGREADRSASLVLYKDESPTAKEGENKISFLR